MRQPSGVQAHARECAQASSRRGLRSGSCSQARTQEQLAFVDGLEIWVTRKRVKNINMRVKPPDGRIEASIPMNLSQVRLEEFVREHRDWIVRNQRAVLDSTQARAANATDEEKRQWREVVEAFVPALIERWEPIMGVKSGKLAYRDMTSRWGSCQPSTGRICINTRLALYPPECLEYVVVHELCHLLVRGHGSDFKALMDLYLPDWRDRRALLRG